VAKPRKGSRAEAAEIVAALARGGTDALRAAEQIASQPRDVLSIRATAETRRLLRLLEAHYGVRGAGAVVALLVRDAARREGLSPSGRMR
jgi:hypothetical protein